MEKSVGSPGVNFTNNVKFSIGPNRIQANVDEHLIYLFSKHVSSIERSGPRRRAVILPI